MYIIPLSKYRNIIIDFNVFFNQRRFEHQMILKKISKFLTKTLGYGLFSMRIRYLKFRGTEMKLRETKAKIRSEAIVGTSNFFGILMVFKLSAFEIPRFSFYYLSGICRKLCWYFANPSEAKKLDIVKYDKSIDYIYIVESTVFSKTLTVHFQPKLFSFHNGFFPIPNK